MISFAIILSLILRIINLNQSLWFDEAINVVYARESTFVWYITYYPIGDFHPPGWFAILWIWTHLFGFSEIASRFPSVVLGTATVWLAYLLGKDLFNKKVGLMGAFLLAIAPLHVYYSQEARMYSLAAFSATASVYFLNRLINRQKWARLEYLISIFLVLYSDYVAYLIIPSQIIYLIWIGRLKLVFKNIVFGLLSIIPLLTIFIQQFANGTNTALNLPGWVNVVGGANFKQLLLVPVKFIFGRVTLEDMKLYTFLSGLVGLIYGGLILYGLRKIDDKVKLLICWIIIPLSLAFIISFYIPILAYFRMLFIIPAFYLLIAKGLEKLGTRLWLGLLVVTLINLIFLGAYYTNPKFQREDWRAAINFVSQNSSSQTIVIFETEEIPAPVRYYGNNLTNFKSGLSEDLTKDIEEKNQVFLFEYLVDIYDPNKLVEQKLKNANFIETKKYDFPGVGFVKLYNKL